MESKTNATIAELKAALRSGSHAEALRIREKLHAADVAELYETLSQIERESLVSTFSDDDFPDFLPYLPTGDADDLLARQSVELQKEILEDLPDDFVVDLIQERGPDQRDRYLSLLNAERRDSAVSLLRFPDDSAGGRMTTAFAAVRSHQTIREVIAELAEHKEETEMLSRIYVVDNRDRLIGKVRLRDLTFNKRSGPITEIMEIATESVSADVDQEEAVHLMSKYDLLSLPVTDAAGQLLGVITYDDALDIQEEEATEDIERQSAISGAPVEESYLNTSILVHLRRRLGWVLGLAILAIASGIVILQFEGMLTASNGAFIIMLYMPMVVAAGGNTGAQAATMVIRAMSLEEFTPSAWARVAWKELRVGLLLGATVGTGIALLVPAVRKTLSMAGHDVQLPDGSGVSQFALTVALALTAQITTSTLLGATLPILARTVKLDPAIVASPAITTIVDVSGLLIYFTLARIILGI